jgi:hypothetical protein
VQNIQPDAIVEFTVNRPVSASITAVIELKSRLQPMGLEGAVHQVLRYRNELHRWGAYQDLYPMVAAPYISRRLCRSCTETHGRLMGWTLLFRKSRFTYLVSELEPPFDFAPKLWQISSLAIIVELRS